MAMAVAVREHPTEGPVASPQGSPAEADRRSRRVIFRSNIPIWPRPHSTLGDRNYAYHCSDKWPLYSCRSSQKAERARMPLVGAERMLPTQACWHRDGRLRTWFSGAQHSRGVGEGESVVCRYEKFAGIQYSLRIDSWEEIRGFAINITAVILGCIGEFPPPPYLAAGSALPRTW